MTFESFWNGAGRLIDHLGLNIAGALVAVLAVLYTIGEFPKLKKEQPTKSNFFKGPAKMPTAQTTDLNYLESKK